MFLTAGRISREFLPEVMFNLTPFSAFQVKPNPPAISTRLTRPHARLSYGSGGEAIAVSLPCLKTATRQSRFIVEYCEQFNLKSENRIQRKSILGIRFIHAMYTLIAF